jgi:predicted tellurium resistance membrane protein TerC
VELLTNPETWVALLTLTALEIVLGIDNIVFISILAGKLPEGQRDMARRVGLLAAMVMRIALLLVLGWVMGLTAPLFEVLSHPFSGRDLILLGGGLFLLAKATWEIHERLEGQEHERKAGPVVSFGAVIVQIMILDIVFSLDSVITAIGMVREVPVMIAAVVIAVMVMLVASGYVTRVIDRHPTLKMLALSFLLLIGVTLVAEGLGQHIDKAYIYFAMGFALLVEILNIRSTRKPKPPVRLHDPYGGRAGADGTETGATPAPETSPA